MSTKIASLSLLVAMGSALSTMSVVSSCSDDKVGYITLIEDDEESIIISGSDGKPITSKTIDAGEEFLLTANQEVSWNVIKGVGCVELEKVSSGTKSAVTATSVKVLAKKTGTATITATSLDGNNQMAEFIIKVNPIGYVDLGLKTKEGKPIYWAKCNIGATKPEEFGYYYAWGEVSIYYDSTKWKGDTEVTGDKTGIWKSGYEEGYAWSNYKFITNYTSGDPSSDNFTKYNGSDYSTLEKDDDVAYQLLGEGWRMPDTTECRMLMDSCYWVYCNGSTDKYNGTSVAGCIVYKSFDTKKDYGIDNKTGHTYSTDTDIHIFLPATRNFDSTRLYVGDKWAQQHRYWTSSLNLSEPRHACVFRIFLGLGELASISSDAKRNCGQPVRAVYVPND